MKFDELSASISGSKSGLTSTLSISWAILNGEPFQNLMLHVKHTSPLTFEHLNVSVFAFKTRTFE